MFRKEKGKQSVTTVTNCEASISWGWKYWQQHRSHQVLNSILAVCWKLRRPTDWRGLVSTQEDASPFCIIVPPFLETLDHPIAW